MKREDAPMDGAQLAPGLASTYFHKSVHENMEVDLSPPFGDFFLDEKPEKPVVLIGAGVGVTPLISMMLYLIETQFDKDIWLIHGVRNGSVALFHGSIREQVKQCSNIHFKVSFSQPLDNDKLGTDYDHKGHTSVSWIKTLLPNMDAQFYVLGPNSFMAQISSDLATYVPKKSIHYECFGPFQELVQEVPKCEKTT